MEVCTKGDESMKRYFVGYGYLLPIRYDDYLNDLLNWVYEDSDQDDGTIICSNEITHEFRYVLGSGD